MSLLSSDLTFEWVQSQGDLCWAACLRMGGCKIWWQDGPPSSPPLVDSSYCLYALYWPLPASPTKKNNLHWLIVGEHHLSIHPPDTEVQCWCYLLSECHRRLYGTFTTPRASTTSGPPTITGSGLSP